MEEPVADGVGQGWLADVVVPLAGWELAGDHGEFLPVPVAPVMRTFWSSIQRQVATLLTRSGPTANVLVGGGEGEWRERLEREASSPESGLLEACEELAAAGAVDAHPSPIELEEQLGHAGVECGEGEEALVADSGEKSTARRSHRDFDLRFVTRARGPVHDPPIYVFTMPTPMFTVLRSGRSRSTDPAVDDGPARLGTVPMTKYPGAAHVTREMAEKPPDFRPMPRTQPRAAALELPQVGAAGELRSGHRRRNPR